MLLFLFIIAFIPNMYSFVLYERVIVLNSGRKELNWALRRSSSLSATKKTG